MLRMSCSIPRRSFVIDASFEIPDGTVFALFGPSAAGKSSILSAIAGFESNVRGRIEVDGAQWLDTTVRPPVNLPAWRRRVGYVEQSARLFPHLTVRQNLLYAVRKSNPFIEAMIEQFDLGSVLDARPTQLSGGQQQRVALARALAPQPRLLLLDEPLTALDWSIRQSLQDLLHEVNRRYEVSMILVTHQLAEAQRLADTLAVIDSGQILQQGPVAEVVLQPNSAQVAARVGYTGTCALPDGRTVGVHPDRVVLGAHPERGFVVSGTVTQEVLREGRRVIHVTSEMGERLQASLHPLDLVTLGENIQITLVDPPVFE